MRKNVLLQIMPFILLAILFLPGGESYAQAALTDTEKACILELFQNGPPQLTMGEARDTCTTKIVDSGNSNSEEPSSLTPGIVEGRLNVDETNILKPFTLMSYRNNYILLAAHNFQSWNSGSYKNEYNTEDFNVDDTEVQFQLSIKIPLAVDLFSRKFDLFAGYTVRSFWQLYNSQNSSPFRETNHEPEFWAQVRPDWGFFGFKNTVNVLGINHMSNGQGGGLSRSWNRIYAAFAFGRGNFALMVRPWVRIGEGMGDDNPDITDYYGHGDLWLTYKLEDHTFSLMTRNNIESGFSTGAVELGWSFPIFSYPYLKGYVQYFSGYGESLIDYDRYVNRVGIGLQFTDLL